VGTDFFVGYDVNAGSMNVIVFEGLVKVCNLAGVCVLVKAGQMTNVRNGEPRPSAARAGHARHAGCNN
jgi:hypothetical protein